MASQASVENTIPILRVQDIHVSLQYYVNVLGFQQDFLEGTGDGAFAGLSRDSHALYLTQADQGQPGTWVWMGVTDARAFHAEFVANGAKIRRELVNYPWALEMLVEDPDGNVLRVGSEPE